LGIPAGLSRSGLHVGTSGYQFPDWAGRFYPPAARVDGSSGEGGNPGVSAGNPAGKWFPFYQRYFSFLELNHTFHQEPTLQQFAELERHSKPGMMFSVKVHKDISHKGAWDAEAGRASMRRHAAAVGPLAETGRFYSFLIQLDEGVERGRKVLDYLLATASEAVGEGLDVHVEFRNRTWHQEAVLQSLKDAGVGICNTDLPALLHAFPLKHYATTGKAYVRYCGLNLAGWLASGPEGANPRPARSARYDYLYSQAELEARVRGQLRLLEKTGAVAAVFSNHAGGKAAINAVQAIHLLGKRMAAGR
jgi:uncharacterized protein YecE (DUF72 family)